MDEPLESEQSSTQDICTIAASLHANSSLQFVLSIVFSINVLALILICLVVMGFLKTKKVHLHLKILFLNLALVVTFRTVCTTLRAARFLLFPLFVKDPCHLLMTYSNCQVFSEISKTPLDILMYGFVAVTLERLVATFVYELYEDIQRPFMCFVCGVIIPWTPVINIVVKHSVQPYNASLIAYCSSLSSGAHDFTQLTYVDIPLCVVCMCGCLVALGLSVHNKRKQVNSLSGRYQLLENIRITRLVASNVFAYCTTLLAHIGALMYVSTAHFPHYVDFAISKEYSSVVLPVYACLFSLIFLVGSEEVFQAECLKHMRRACRLGTVNSVAPLATGNDYFKQYEERWR